MKTRASWGEYVKKWWKKEKRHPTATKEDAKARIFRKPPNQEFVDSNEGSDIGELS